jgi:hypothetical protein
MGFWAYSVCHCALSNFQNNFIAIFLFLSIDKNIALYYSVKSVNLLKTLSEKHSLNRHNNNINLHGLDTQTKKTVSKVPPPFFGCCARKLRTRKHRREKSTPEMGLGVAQSKNTLRLQNSV